MVDVRLAIRTLSAAIVALSEAIVLLRLETSALSDDSLEACDDTTVL